MFSSSTISQIASNSSLRKVVPVGFCGEHKEISVACFIKGRMSLAAGMKLFSVIVDDLLFQFFWNWENSRIKIADSKIVNGLSVANFFTDLASELHDLGTDQSFRKIGQLHFNLIKEIRENY